MQHKGMRYLLEDLQAKVEHRLASVAKTPFGFRGRKPGTPAAPTGLSFERLAKRSSEEVLETIADLIPYLVRAVVGVRTRFGNLDIIDATVRFANQRISMS
jgi:hypothetical protein